MNKSRLTSSLLAAVLAAAPLTLAQAQTPPAPSAAAAPGRPGRERHPDMRRARRALEVAKRQLEHAAHDFAGHRAKALELVNQAIAEIDAGLQSDQK